MTPIDADALKDRLEEERKYLLANGMNGAEHILVHHCLRIVDEMIDLFYANKHLAERIQSRKEGE